MARPELIARIHAAWYDYITASPAQSQDAYSHYLELLRDAASLYGEDIVVLKNVLRKDFPVWRNQEGLPKPPSPTDSPT